jgi:DNA-binding LytR/AlgR family response regulator
MNAGRATAVIADDEPRLAEYLRDRLAVLWPELVIAGIAHNGPEAQALIEREAPDISPASTSRGRRAASCGSCS